MTASRLRSGRRQRCTVCALVLLPLALSGCYPTDETSTEARFATTTADIAVAPEVEVDVNLIFVAQREDAIWSSLDSVTLLGSNQQSGDIRVGSGRLTVDAGDTNGKAILGNVRFSFPLPGEGNESSYSFSRAALSFVDSTEAVVVDVGSWHAERRPSESPLEMTDESVIALPECGPIGATVRNTSDDTVRISSVETRAPGVAARNLQVVDSLRPGDTGNVAFQLECDDSADFQIITPRVTLESGHSRQETFLDTVSIGFTGITTTTIEKIVARGETRPQ